MRYLQSALRKQLKAYFCLSFAVSVVFLASCSAQQQRKRKDGNPPVAGPSGPVNTSPMGWLRYEFENQNTGVISVILPQQAEDLGSANFKTFAGNILSTHIYLTARDAKLYFVVFINNLPAAAESMSERDKSELFYGCWRGIAERVSGSLRQKFNRPFDVAANAQRKTMLGNREGRGQNFNIGTERGRAQIIFANQNAFMLVAIWNQNGSVEEPTAFLDSFQVKLKS